MYKPTMQQQSLLKLIAAVCLSTSLSSCVTSEKRLEKQTQEKNECDLVSKNYSWPSTNPPKLIWLSLDSLNLSGLEEIVGQLKSPHPRGLKWLFESQNKNPYLTIIEPTITSSSHISTITCSSAGTHGIFANSQWNGAKMISGFNAPFATETFATTLKNAGLKVVSAGYPSLDNSEPGRQVSEGFSYGESSGRSQIHTLVPDQPITHVWKDNNGNVIEELSFTGNEIANFKNFSCKQNRCTFEHSAVGNLVDITINTQKQNYRAYAQPLQNEKTSIFISQLSSNKSFPEEFLKKQEKCGKIFSPGKDHTLAQFGAKQLIYGFEHRLKFFDWHWTYYLPKTDADVLFLYLEDIDALRHQYAGDFQAREAVAEHYARVDEVVGRFIASLPMATNVVVLGDHGMSTISKELNIRKILPAKALAETYIVTSGGTLMLYGRKSQGQDLSVLPDSSERDWLQDAKNKILDFRLPGSNEAVFHKAFIKGTPEIQNAGLAHKNAPFLIAFANENFALQNAMVNELILGDIHDPSKPTPRPRGQHGHTQDSTKMKTFLAGWGPVLDTIRLSEVKSNIDLVPTLGKAFSWQIPPQCRSK